MTLQSSPAHGEDWNFTGTDYLNLKQTKKDLYFVTSSNWLPPSIQKNLLHTIKYVLNPNLKPMSTFGINPNDFYHGHLACKKTRKQREFAVGEHIAQTHDKIIAEHQLVNYPFIAPDEIPRLAQALEKTISTAKKDIQRISDPNFCDNLVVIYHTFEWNNPDLIKGDRRRNFLTSVPANRITHFSPPNLNESGSITERYTYLMQFAFLIDQHGGVWATLGSRHSLATITGKLNPFPDGYVF